MGRIYRSEDKHLPKELRELFKAAQGPRRMPALTSVKSFDPAEEMIIEGCANMAKPDRVSEVIDPKAWRLDNFKRNAVMLYEHDRFRPVGLCLDTSVTDQGLFFRSVIGNPKLASLTDDQIKVRSLLAQGILKTNSVGFIPHQLEFDEALEVLRYTVVELLEISIVSIPMQQDSIITSVKSWRARSMDTPTQTAVEKAIADQVVLVKQCHEMLTGITSKHQDEVKALTAQIEQLKTASAALTTENGELKTAYETLNTKSVALLTKLREAGLIKS